MQNEILVGRINARLTRLFAMTGGAPAPQLSSEVMPVTGLMSREEERVLEDVRSYAGSTAIAAVAAKVGQGRLHNAAGSNIIGVVTRLMFFADGGADRVQIGLGSTAATGLAQNPAAGQANNPIDSRIAGAAALKVTFDQGAPTVQAANIWDGRTNSAGPVILCGSWMVAPGAGIDIKFGTNNNACYVGFEWYERAMANGESGPF